MATKALDVESTALDGEHYRMEFGFLMLALAQLVSLFAVWFGYWPTSFGMAESLGQGFAGFFLCCGIAGFYLSFRTLSLT